MSAAQTCPGPNGNGCNCDAEGKDPLCPWWPLHPEDVERNEMTLTEAEQIALATLVAIADNENENPDVRIAAARAILVRPTKRGRDAR